MKAQKIQYSLEMVPIDLEKDITFRLFFAKPLLYLARIILNHTIEIRTTMKVKDAKTKK